MNIDVDIHNDMDIQSPTNIHAQLSIIKRRIGFPSKRMDIHV